MAETGTSSTTRQDSAALQFAIQLAMTNGNVAESARAVGWSPDRGRRYVRDNPDVYDVARQAVGITTKQTLKRWADLHADAMDKIENLMKFAEDERVQLKAAEDVIERVEGKVPQKVDIDETDIRDILAHVTMRFITAVHLTQGMTYAEAKLYADKNPEQVQAWGRARGLIKAGESDA